MQKESTTFSSDTGQATIKDYEETSKLAEQYFGVSNDPEQMKPSDESRDWVLKNAKDYSNVIKYKGNTIGFIFMLPSNKSIMKQFLERNITEARFFDKIKKIKWIGCPEAIYLCAGFIKPKFRRKGLVFTATIKSLNKITENLKHKPTLFYWAYTKEGEKFAEKVASVTGLKLLKRKITS
jgi:hypothetical protein